MLPLVRFVNSLRPRRAGDIATAQDNVDRAITRLNASPEDVVQLGQALRSLLGVPCQSSFYAEAGVRSSLGFWLELRQRVADKLLPPAQDTPRLLSILGQVFHHPRDHVWVSGVTTSSWCKLLNVLLAHPQSSSEPASQPIIVNVIAAIRILSYRLAGAGLDQELLRAEPDLERYESPFLAQNAALLPLLQRLQSHGDTPQPVDIRDIDVMLDQCMAALDRVRRKARENGISIRLTYLLARMRQLIQRLRLLLDSMAADDRQRVAIDIFKTLLAEEQARDQIPEFVGENFSLVARNITDHASRHGEHYIAESRSEWFAMLRSAAGGGAIIAFMAAIKIKLSLLHLPPLTEGILFGLNYGIGFALIHMLGLTVATKQPAMTAASIAATLEEARPRDLERLGDLAQNVVRTQFVAVVGNIALALPVAWLIANFWSGLFDVALAPQEKLMNMMSEVHPLQSGALFFAAIAGIGLFLSGLVSGYFDNQARYHALGARLTSVPRLAWMAEKLDAHYGAILGNLFFGMYLGLMGNMEGLTGLPLNIRHVAFSTANLGSVLATEPYESLTKVLPWTIVGIVGIALINLLVSFSLALYVAMKARRLGARQMLRLSILMFNRFMRNPVSFVLPPGTKAD